MLKISLTSFGAFSILPIFVSLVFWKQLVVERNEKKNGRRRLVFNRVYRVLLTVKCSWSFWGHLVHFWLSTTLYLESGWSYRKMGWHLVFRDTSNTHMRYLRPCRVQGHFVVIRYTCLKIARISKTAGYRAKQSKIWEAWILVAHVCVTFELVGFKVILGHWVHFFKMTCISKTAGHRAKGSEIWSSRIPVTLIWGTVDLGGLMSILGYSVQFFFKMACNSTMSGCRAKLTEIWNRGQ